MDPSRRPVIQSLLLAAGVLTLGLAVVLLLLPVPGWLRALLPAVIAVVLLFVSVRAASRGSRRGVELSERLAARDKEWSQLRHDLRGILSPAMLTADRLTASPDPAVRRAGETMVATVERAEQRLRAVPPDRTGTGRG